MNFVFTVLSGAWGRCLEVFDDFFIYSGKLSGLACECNFICGSCQPAKKMNKFQWLGISTWFVGYYVSGVNY